MKLTEEADINRRNNKLIFMPQYLVCLMKWAISFKTKSYHLFEKKQNICIILLSLKKLNQQMKTFPQSKLLTQMVVLASANKQSWGKLMPTLKSQAVFLHAKDYISYVIICQNNQKKKMFCAGGSKPLGVQAFCRQSYPRPGGSMVSFTCLQVQHRQ